MLQVFCIATEEKAEGVISRILQMGIAPEKVSVVTACSEMDDIAVPARELRRHVLMGFGFGASIGWFIGTAMIALATVTAPWTGELIMIPLTTAMVGTVLGPVAGASGGFYKPRMSSNLVRHYGEEVRQGKVLISVELDDVRKRDMLAAMLTGLGGMDVHYSDEKTDSYKNVVDWDKKTSRSASAAGK